MIINKLTRELLKVTIFVSGKSCMSRFQTTSHLWKLQSILFCETDLEIQTMLLKLVKLDLSANVVGSGGVLFVCLFFKGTK